MNLLNINFANVRKVSTFVVSGVFFSAIALAQTPPTSPVFPAPESPTERDVQYNSGVLQRWDKSHATLTAVNKLIEIVKVFETNTMAGIANTDSDVKALQTQVSKVLDILDIANATIQKISGGVQSLESAVAAVNSGVQANGQGIQANGQTLVKVLSEEEAIKAAIAKIGGQATQSAYFEVEELLAGKRYLVPLSVKGEKGLLDIVKIVVNNRFEQVPKNNKHYKEAKEDLTKANEAYDKDNVKLALSQYGRAYRELVREIESRWLHTPFSR